MLGFELDADRLSRSRFGLSKAAEMFNALEAVVHPERAPHAQRGLAGITRRVDRSRIVVLLSIAHRAESYVPDFLTPIPDRFEPDLEDELAVVESAPASRIGTEIRRAFPHGDLPTEVRAVLDRKGEDGLARWAAAELRYFWKAEFGRLWPSIRTVLEDDIRAQTDAAARNGFGSLLNGLHPGIGWDGSHVWLDNRLDRTFPVSDGLVVTPSAFLPRQTMWLGEPGAAMIGYPARGRGRVWERPEASAYERSPAVFGARPARLLADLDIARSTTELAERAGLAASTVSYHLARLRRAGLVMGRRSGRVVRYERTARGAAVTSVFDVE